MRAPTVALGAVLAVLAGWDIATRRLPDWLTLPLAAAGPLVGWAASGSAPGACLAGAVLTFAALALLAAALRIVGGRDMLGLGDAKLAAAGAAWLGWQAVPSMLLLAAAGGTCWVLAFAAVEGKRALSDPVPFGVPLAGAIWLLWLYGA